MDSGVELEAVVLGEALEEVEGEPEGSEADEAVVEAAVWEDREGEAEELTVQHRQLMTDTVGLVSWKYIKPRFLIAENFFTKWPSDPIVSLLFQFGMVTFVIEQQCLIYI